MTGNYTGIKYDDDCGFFAVKDGVIVCPAEGIDGTRQSAERALAWTSIAWAFVAPLPEEEKCVWDTADYLSIPF